MPPEENADIARQAVSGSAYSVAASVITLSLGFIRAALMARLLLPEHFGVATLALFYVNLVATLRSLGVDNALIHRKDANETVVGTYFVMRLALMALSVVVLGALAPLLGRFYPGMPMFTVVLFAYLGIIVLKDVVAMQMTMLSKGLAFPQMAVTDVISSATMTIVGPVLAWQGFGVWSIVAEQASGLSVRALLIWLVYPAWRPHFAWDWQIARWFWGYGIKLWTVSNLNFLLDRFDDWWIGSFLGSSPLGFYSRAFEFANYPERAISRPVLSVFFPTFARLQDDRRRLSRAFFRATSLMVRASGLLSLIFVLTAPEFIRFILGERWLPMLVTFQLMIVYTLLNPLATGASNVLLATGHPGVVARTRLLQVLVFVPAVAALGVLFGIEGVALAADLMMLLGTFLLFRHTRAVVDYSQRSLWFWPLAALIVTATITLILSPVWRQLPIWAALIGKAALITLTYTGLLWLTEREELLTGWRMIRGLIGPRLKAI